MGKTNVLGASCYFYKATQYYKKILGFHFGDNKVCVPFGLFRHVATEASEELLP
jgi:hypothetical protein